MPTTTDLYPPAPATVPPELTRVPPEYRSRAAAMIAGLFGFLLLYLALIAAAGLLAYWLTTFEMDTGSRKGRGSAMPIIFQLGGILAAGLLFLFLVKGLFKGQRAGRSNHVELHERDYPELFAFIRRVNEDTGAPRPRRVYASPDVNAALIYDTSLVNLVIPPKKDLLIGLGLVNVLTLSEFKGVMAHEFGHFAQRSVGLGSYLYVANRIMHDVIYSRDALDRFVDVWARIDLRISFPAWGLKAIMWLVRKILEGLYRSLNLLHLSLSRQMEFNADNVAVSVAGSDAIVNGLFRLEFAVEALTDASASLDIAADRGSFSDDLFFHQTRSAERLRKLRKNELLGVPPHPDTTATTPEFIFPQVDDGISDKYRSHPTDHMREKNAKRMYVPCALDSRSAWLLFGDAAAIKQELTEVYYKTALKRIERYVPTPAEEVQKLIDAENAETTFGERYHGFYDDRFLNPGDPKETTLPSGVDDLLLNQLRGWPSADLEEHNKKYRELQGELNMLEGLKSGQYTLKAMTFPFRGEDKTIRDVDRLVKGVKEEFDSKVGEFDKTDRQVFLMHLAAARRADRTGDGSTEAELLERYRFHLKLQDLLRSLLAEEGRMQGILNFLSGTPQMNEADFRSITDGLEEVRQSLRDTLVDSKKVRAPAMTNVPAGEPLYDLIVDRTDVSVERLEGNTITSEWLTKLMTRLDGVLTRTRRLHYKSLGSLLAFQEKLAATLVDEPEA